MIERTFDAERINYLINHPEIRPFVGGDISIPVDLTAVVQDDKNFMLTGEYGGFCYTWSAPETYEVHTFILPEGRGRKAYKLARASLEYMVEQGASHIWTRVQREAENVKHFTLAAGFVPCGEQVVDLGAGPTLYDLFSWRK